MTETDRPAARKAGQDTQDPRRHAATSLGARHVGPERAAMARETEGGRLRGALPANKAKLLRVVRRRCRCGVVFETDRPRQYDCARCGGRP